METKITVRDAAGETVHSITTFAVKMDYTSKIGTVVITDLRIGKPGLPIGLVTQATLRAGAVVITADLNDWSVSDGSGKPYLSSKTPFYLVVSGTNLLQV